MSFVIIYWFGGENWFNISQRGCFCNEHVAAFGLHFWKIMFWAWLEFVSELRLPWKECFDGRVWDYLGSY